MVVAKAKILCTLQPEQWAFKSGRSIDFVAARCLMTCQDLVMTQSDSSAGNGSVKRQPVVWLGVLIAMRQE